MRTWRGLIMTRAAAILVLGVTMAYTVPVAVPTASAGEKKSMMTPPSLAPDRWLSFSRASRAPFGDRKTTHLSTVEGGGLLDSASEPMATVRLPHYDPRARRTAGGLAETTREIRKLEDRERRAASRNPVDRLRRSSVDTGRSGSTLGKRSRSSIP